MKIQRQAQFAHAPAAEKTVLDLLVVPQKFHAKSSFVEQPAGPTPRVIFEQGEM
jgi:hypothetical protein